MKRLFLDDVRQPKDCLTYMVNKDVYKNEWDVVRSFKEFVNYINDNGVPDVVSFDHDLADEHYSDEMYYGVEKYNKLYNTFREKTGYDCAKWLCHYCVENKIPLPKYYVHSMNPVGKENILGVLQTCERVLGF